MDATSTRPAHHTARWYDANLNRYAFNDPVDLRDQRAYFARQRELAEDYARNYGEGVLEVEIPRDVYDARIRRYEVPYQGGPQVELPIPHKDFDVLNEAQRRLRGGN